MPADRVAGGSHRKSTTADPSSDQNAVTLFGGSGFAARALSVPVSTQAAVSSKQTMRFIVTPPYDKMIVGDRMEPRLAILKKITLTLLL